MRYLQRGLTHRDTARATPGFTLFTPLRNSTTYLVNMAGEIVHQWDLPAGPTNYGYLLPNGNLLIALRSHDSPHDMARGGIMRELDWDGNVVSEYIDPYQHHDFRRCANGNLMYLGWHLLPEEHVARVQGGIPGSEHELGIWGDYIREVNPVGETVWQWNGWEHMEIEKYPLPPTSNRHEFAHPNTLVALDDGNALICFRHISMIAIVDRTSGEFAWSRQDLSWGGPHDIQFLDNGNMMIFANGDGCRPRGSKVIEFDQQSGDTIWQYQGNPSHTFDSFFISGCQRLWSGNTLICEGIWGRIFEVTPAGDMVWEYINPFTGRQEAPGPSVGDVSFVFRAYRYAPDGPEIQSRLHGQLG
jgi:hypothetical protein